MDQTYKIMKHDILTSLLWQNIKDLNKILVA